MTPHVGQVIRLEDARGCWRLHIVSLRDKRFDDAIELRGRAWSGLRFVRRSPTTFRDGPIYQAGRPAIGSPHTPFSPLYLPAGWHAPVGFERTA